jgi:hypothetical protein
MITRRIVAASAAAVVVAAGGAAAIAATVKDDRKAAETAILSDAAKRLDVSPSELKDALGKAQDAQLDQAVKDGKLTQAQADAMKKRRAQEGTVLGLGPGGPHGRGFGHHGGPGGMRGGLFGLADDAAKALGLTRAKLFEQLQSGKTLTEIAKAQGKDLADVKSAVKAALVKRLDAAVKDKKLTDAQRDHIVGEFDEHFDAFASGKGPMGGEGRHGHGGPGFPPPGAPPAPPESGTQEDGSYPSDAAPQTQSS